MMQNYPRQILLSDAERKRQKDAILNFEAARVAATASTQHDDSRPEDPPGRFHPPLAWGSQAGETVAARKSLEAARVETQKLRDQLQEQLDVLRAHALEDKKHALEDKKLARQYEAEAIAARDVELGQASLRGSLTQAELERTRAL